MLEVEGRVKVVTVGKKSWRDGSALEIQDGSLPSVTPVPGDPVPSSGLLGNACMCAYTCLHT